MMTEDFLHFIWQQQLYFSENMQTSDGEKIRIERPGTHNTNAGPDFTDARVYIGDTLWVGCLEIHFRSSDWERHGHHMDPAYNNVIMHVVYEYDADTFNAKGQKIPTIVLHFDSRYLENYKKLVENKNIIPCRNQINQMDSINLTLWMERLGVERLEQKTEAILETYRETNNDWEETLYRRLARNFGFSLNAFPFEQLAKSLPFKTLLKHKDQLMQIEALLFGQSGMLDQNILDDLYFSELQKEYRFLKKKYELTPIEGFLWKFLRLRPVNFPTIRLSQFASLIHHTEHLFSKIIAIDSIDHFERLFEVQASEYWDTHYVFGKESKKQRKSLGKMAFYTIMINTIVPFLFAYGKVRDKQEYCNRAIKLLETLPPEKNSILTQWEQIGMKHSDAFLSQALLQLKNEYCARKRCLHCVVGNRIMIS